MSSNRASTIFDLASASPGSRKRVLLAPVVMGIALLVINLLDKHFPAAIWFTMPWKMAGWLPIMIGCALCAFGAGHFIRKRTTIMPGQDSRALVTTGVFAFSRNPMYLGMSIILVGVCFIAGAATVWLVPPVFVWVIDRHLIRLEESMLCERFGDEYRAYRQRVRRWV